MRKVAWSIEYAEEIGKTLAAEGWTEGEVLDWLEANGRPAYGTTAARVLAAFWAQADRG